MSEVYNIYRIKLNYPKGMEWDGTLSGHNFIHALERGVNERWLPHDLEPGTVAEITLPSGYVVSMGLHSIL